MNYLKKFIYAIAFMTCACHAKQPFVVGELQGQLGNQMFQVAAATALALDNGAAPIFPDFKRMTKWDIPGNFQNVFFRLNTSKPYKKPSVLYKEPVFTYQPIPYTPNMRIHGFFQSEKYFKHHKDEIIALFQPSDTILNYLHNKYSYILEHPYSVAIHVRTYLETDPQHTAFVLNGVEYISEALELFPDDSLLVVFSDNIPWCKEQFKQIPREFIYIEGETHYIDFYLMSFCKDNIISNSSFSWWAAYLNPNPNKLVIAPSRWFNPNLANHDSRDIVPEEWITIP